MLSRRTRPLLRDDVLDVRAQLDRAIGHLQILERAADVSGRQVEELPRLLVDEDEEARRIDHDLGNGRFLEGRVADDSPRRRLTAGMEVAMAEHGVVLTRTLPSTTFSKTRHFNSTGVNISLWLTSISALPRKRIRPAVQGEVEPRDDPGLRLGIEVHESVAAAQKIDVRDRRVEDEVMAPEDHRSAQLGAKDVASPLALEVLFEQRRRHTLDVCLSVARLAGQTERLLVHVGGVDLDACPELSYPRTSARSIASV